jgi:hypothetical protein
MVKVAADWGLISSSTIRLCKAREKTICIVLKPHRPGRSRRFRQSLPPLHDSKPGGCYDAAIRVYDEAGSVIETYEHKGDFKEQ